MTVSPGSYTRRAAGRFHGFQRLGSTRTNVLAMQENFEVADAALAAIEADVVTLQSEGASLVDIEGICPPFSGSFIPHPGNPVMGVVHPPYCILPAGDVLC